MDEGDIDMKAVGARVALARRALGFKTKGELADLLECNRSNWSGYENGKRLIPPRFVAQLMRRYGVTFDYIYAGREDKLPADLRDAIHRLSRESG